MRIVALFSDYFMTRGTRRSFIDSSPTKRENCNYLRRIAAKRAKNARLVLPFPSKNTPLTISVSAVYFGTNEDRNTLLTSGKRHYALLASNDGAREIRGTERWTLNFDAV